VNRRASLEEGRTEQLECERGLDDIVATIGGA